MMTCQSQASMVILVTMLLPMSAFAQLSFERAPIEYSRTQPNDSVAKLKDAVSSSNEKVLRDDERGYLESLLAALKVPISSQTLVFSKTSLQRHRISPKNPRAVYFNDEVYVAWTPGAELIEIAAIDPLLGTVFYTVDQDQASTESLEITRRIHRCLFCHGSTDTGRVPGLLMQSVFTDSDGHRVFPSDSIAPSARGPLLGRWGGWYATGQHGAQRHLGNLMIDSADVVVPEKLGQTANVIDLTPYCDVSKYLSPHSDLVALLVLQHQVTLHNLITSANHRARLLMHSRSERETIPSSSAETISDEVRVLIDQIAEEVVDGLLLVEQPDWQEALVGSSSFAQEFVSRGPFDPRGRSLRQLDLCRSLFRFPCSYLIYSDAFDALPNPVLQRIYARLYDVLRGIDRRLKYGYLSKEQRLAIDQILTDTKPFIASEFEKRQRALTQGE